MIFGHFIDFGHFPIEIPIEAEKFYGQQKEGSHIKNKNCFEILVAKEMGLDRVPCIEYQTFYFCHFPIEIPIEAKKKYPHGKEGS